MLNFKTLLKCAIALSIVPSVTVGAQAEGILNGETLRIATIDDPFFLTMQKVRPELEKRLGGKIEFEIRPFDVARQQALLNAQNATSNIDILAVDLPQFGEYKDMLVDLNPLVKSAGVDLSDYEKPILEAGIQGDRLLGLPIMNIPEVFVYRKDLLEEAGISPPKTIDEVLAAAEKLNNSKPGLAGICWNGKRGTPLGQTVLQTMGGEFQTPIIKLAKKSDGNYDTANVTPENMKPNLDSEGARQTAEYLVKLMKFSPPDILNMAWEERSRTYAQGGCAMLYEWTSLSVHWENDPNSPAYRKSGYIPHPAGPSGRNLSILGGFEFGIPNNVPADRQKMVFDALVALSSPEMQELYIRNGGCVATRKSVAVNPEFQKLCPAIGPIHEMMEKGEVAHWQRPQIVELQQIVDVVGAEFHKLLAGDQSVDDTISASQKEVDRQMRKAGYY